MCSGARRGRGEDGVCWAGFESSEGVVLREGEEAGREGSARGAQGGGEHVHSVFCRRESVLDQRDRRKPMSESAYSPATNRDLPLVRETSP